jgi:riboflavin synthase
MFTGIVEERGVVRSREGGRLTVACRTVTHDSSIGASVAVNGTCLTVVERGDDHLAFDLSAETLARTSLGGLTAGRPVNLERPVSLAARLGGHLVQGHVDGVGAIARIDPSPDGGALVRVRVPPELMHAVVSKGSITVDGVSLTVAELHADGISIALIPHTLAATTFGGASTGDPVNLEVDVIARYVERLMERSGHG